MVQEGEVALTDSIPSLPSSGQIPETISDIPESVTAQENATDSTGSLQVSSARISYGENAVKRPQLLPVDSLGNFLSDVSLTSDTTLNEHEATYGILLTPPESFSPPPRAKDFNTGMSFIIGALIILFLIIGLRFRNNGKFIGALMKNLVETKTRHNVFDDTVRETSLLIILNVMWCACAGIIIFRLLELNLQSPYDSILSPASNPPLAIVSGIIAAVAYTVFMILAYIGIGTVFSNLDHGRLWLKGFLASQGILGFLYFPLALLFLCYPQWNVILLWIALILFVMLKLIFIWKGMRIFFTQFSSWVLFLYYLCSLEIVPLILTYWATVFLWGILG